MEFNMQTNDSGQDGKDDDSQNGNKKRKMIDTNVQGSKLPCNEIPCPSCYKDIPQNDYLSHIETCGKEVAHIQQVHPIGTFPVTSPPMHPQRLDNAELSQAVHSQVPAEVPDQLVNVQTGSIGVTTRALNPRAVYYAESSRAVHLRVPAKPHNQNQIAQTRPFGVTLQAVDSEDVEVKEVTSQTMRPQGDDAEPSQAVHTRGVPVTPNQINIVQQEDNVQPEIIPVKVEVEFGRVYRINMPLRATLQDLHTLICERLRCDPDSYETLYEDGDGDWITMSINEDLRTCVQDALRCGRSFIRMSIVKFLL